MNEKILSNFSKNTGILAAGGLYIQPTGSRKKAHLKNVHRKQTHRKKPHRKKRSRKKAHAEKNALGNKHSSKKAQIQLY